MFHRAHNQQHIACMAIGGSVLIILLLFHALSWLRDEEKNHQLVFDAVARQKHLKVVVLHVDSGTDDAATCIYVGDSAKHKRLSD